MEAYRPFAPEIVLSAAAESTGRSQTRTVCRHDPLMTTDQGRQPGAPALPHDLFDLSTKDLESVVTRVCSAYGTVVKVAVHHSHAHLNVCAFALVDMSGPREAERLAIAFNRQRVGSAVVLLLQPRPAS